MKKWRYSSQARKRRYCEACGQALTKDEVILCTECFSDIVNDEISEVVEND
jgi:predicted nucleic acid-binding Zn ribbon protein